MAETPSWVVDGPSLVGCRTPGLLLTVFAGNLEPLPRRLTCQMAYCADAIFPSRPFMRKAVIISQNGMGSGDTELGLVLLRRYLRHDLEKDDRAERYVFYNGGVQAALLDDEVHGYLRQLEERGSMVLLCGTCLDHFGLTARLDVGRNACLGDVRESMAMGRVDYL
jgi:hypothetical protein